LNESCHRIFHKTLSCLKQITIQDLKTLLPYVLDDKLFKAAFNATTAPRFN
jgi:hypothetical protein